MAKICGKRKDPTLRLALFLLLAFTTHAQEVRRTPLPLKDGGTPEKPAVFDGKAEQSNNEWRKP